MTKDECLSIFRRKKIILFYLCLHNTLGYKIENSQGYKQHQGY
jgi:hypothetical protein